MEGTRGCVIHSPDYMAYLFSVLKQSSLEKSLCKKETVGNDRIKVVDDL